MVHIELEHAQLNGMHVHVISLLGMGMADKNHMICNTHGYCLKKRQVVFLVILTALTNNSRVSSSRGDRGKASSPPPQTFDFN